MRTEHFKAALIRYWRVFMWIGGIITLFGFFLSGFDAVKLIGLPVMAIGTLLFVCGCFLWASSDW
jgi:hypothetical protein